jgi:pimeloyl-ACP methyl ester carboxylesterase
MNTVHHIESEMVPTRRDVISDAERATACDEPRREPIWRVVGASLAAGFLGAIVLTLGVFGGAAEHVITGTALLAFAAGWATLVLLSSRFTSQPQRWARVPAAFMAVASLVLLIAQPDDQALNNAGWVWPPAVLALAVWMVVQLRRNLSGRVRWLIYPIVGSLAISAVGGMYETAARAHDENAYPAPGTLFDVGGRRLHMHCTGTGSPTIVLENGLGATSAGWTRITTELNQTTRVCTYDRAGQGWSDDVDTPQDGLAIAADLHALLARANESGPYVLVGHSAGGPYVMTFAATYPDEVAGMVLLDSMSPDAFTDLPGFAGEQSMMSRGLGVLPSLTRFGAGRIVPTSAWSSLPEPAASRVQAFAASARGMRNMRDEQSMYPTVFEQAKALTSIDSKPLVVVTATESIDKHEEWVGLQERLAALSTNNDHRVADATHIGLTDDIESFEASVQAIVDVVQSVRTEQPIATR